MNLASHIPRQRIVCALIGDHDCGRPRFSRRICASAPYLLRFRGNDGWRNFALCFRNGDGMLVMTNSSNGEGIFKPLAEALLGETDFPFDWDGYTPYDKLPPL